MIADAIRVSRSLNLIDVGYNGIDQAAALELLAVMKEKAMVSIGMAGCKLGVEGAKVVAEMAAVSRSLSRLLIGSNAIGDTGCIALAEAMQQNDNCKIEELNLHCNVIGAPGAKSLAAMMAVSRSLSKVFPPSF